jgi:hypothetical protein
MNYEVRNETFNKTTKFGKAWQKYQCGNDKFWNLKT